MLCLKQYILGKYSSVIFFSNRNTKDDVRSENLLTDMLNHKENAEQKKIIDE